MSTPNALWNNDGKATTQIGGTKADLNAGLYQGRLKAKQPEKYALSSNRKSWNNDGKATTQLNASAAATGAGKIPWWNESEEAGREEQQD